MRVSTIVGKDELIKARLEEGYSFQLLSKELGVGCHTLINCGRLTPQGTKRCSCSLRAGKLQ